MTAKKRFLAFFFSVLMIWQGFFWAKAEGINPLVLAEDAQGGTRIKEIVNECSCTVRKQATENKR